MAEPFNLKSIPLLAASSLMLSRHLLSVKEREFIVDLEEGPTILLGKWLMINIFTWRPLIKRGMPVAKRHTLSEGLFSREALARVQTEIYNDIIAVHKRQSGMVTAEVEAELLYDLTEIINDLHTVAATQLGEYHVSISAFELADLLAHPDVAPLTQVDLSQEMTVSIEAAEAKLKENGNAILKKLLDRTIPSNVIAPFLELGLLSPKQFPQVVAALGFRDDAADTRVRLPITSSYVSGLQNIMEVATDALAAKKTAYYSHNAMPDAQYSNRKQQILASVVRQLYPGDCGTTLTVPFYIHNDNKNNVLDKNIVEGGQLIRLTERNVGQYVGHTVQFRSPLACRHTDGICHTCGGSITDFMPPKSVVGLASTVEYMSHASQLVLSAKHFTSTSAITYKVPDLLHDFLIVKQNDIYIRNTIDVANLKIGVMFSDVSQINDLQYLEDDSVIGEQQFSTINYITFATEDEVPVTGEVPMISDSTVPYFSSEILAYIKDNFKSISIGDMVWIPLKRFDHLKDPLLRCVIESNSMIKFNSALTRFTTSDIRRYTSLGQVLADFTAIVYREINTNIMHIEVVLKSYLITGPNNYNIPLVTDVNNVMFSDLNSIIPRRSLGGQYAFEQLPKFLADPQTYVAPHKIGIFDPFFYTDTE